MKRTHIIIGAVSLSVALIAIFFVLFLSGGTPRRAVVMIPPGATSEMVSDSLTKAYGSDYSRRLISTASLLGQDLASHPGLYDFAKGTARWRVVLYMGRGRQTPVRLTVNNLRTRADVLRSVSSRFHFSAEQLDSALNAPQTLAGFGLTRDNATALFLNNTFEAWWTDSPSRVIERIGEAYSRFWNEERRAQAEALGLTPAEVITIASIAEEETTHADERGRIGRLYINRLDKGMRLQADPTVRFAINDFTVRRIGRDMLWVESPYNTYRRAGLPPGPIRTVEPATVDAVLQSKPSDDLYMCAKADFSGYHKFASDYAEHQRNALEYRAALDAKGIK